jgi:hydroxymethylglutaryl-CoA reductase (NADPH)
MELPRALADAQDYTAEIIHQRQRFVEEYAGRGLRHINHFSFDPEAVQGNCENLTGVAQVPLGFAGPIVIRGEAAQGEFLVPLATTEGTLVASYNRGIQLLNLCGGAKCTVLADGMQRAPVFGFEDARKALQFVSWVREHEGEIRAQAESTSHVARVQLLEPYLASRYAYLRFSYATGDAAGQNMVNKATDAACRWILANAAEIRDFCLDSNFSSDKKSSFVNTLRGRGKRVVAEVVVPREMLVDRLHADPETMVHQYQVTNLSSLAAGVNNNGLHAANALAAIFIATGQDVANVAESCAGLLDVQMTPERNLYASITLPSLIVATHGGGTGLATQQECLELMGCTGPGSSRKLAEIVAGVVLAGELSLGAAILADEWVSSHERMGRNR